MWWYWWAWGLSSIWVVNWISHLYSLSWFVYSGVFFDTDTLLILTLTVIHLLASNYLEKTRSWFSVILFFVIQRFCKILACRKSFPVDAHEMTHIQLNSCLLQSFNPPWAMLKSLFQTLQCTRLSLFLTSLGKVRQDIIFYSFRWSGFCIFIFWENKSPPTLKFDWYT